MVGGTEASFEDSPKQRVPSRKLWTEENGCFFHLYIDLSSCSPRASRPHLRVRIVIDRYVMAP